MASSDLLSGTPFRMLALRGRDDIADLVVAETREGGEPVLVKILRVDAEANAELKDRFCREAWVLERARHPNIVVSRASGVTDLGRPYLAFDALEGTRLHYELANPLPISDAIRAMCDLLSALSYLHGLGIVHRDVQPENILLGKPRGASATDDARKVMLLNFGLAQIGSDDAIPGAKRVSFGERIYTGSPHFAAPEQAGGDLVDARADVYAVGAVLYTLLTGCYLLDTGRGAEELKETRLHAMPTPPSVRRLGASSPELDRIVMLALAKDPNERPQTANELRELLERLLPSAAFVTTGQVSRVQPASRSQEGRAIAVPTATEPETSRSALPEPVLPSAYALPETAPMADRPSHPVSTAITVDANSAVVPVFEGQSGALEPAVGRRDFVIFVLAVVTVAVAVMLGVGWTLLRFFL